MSVSIAMPLTGEDDDYDTTQYTVYEYTVNVHYTPYMCIVLVTQCIYHVAWLLWHIIVPH